MSAGAPKMWTGRSARRPVGDRGARGVGVEVERHRVDVGEHRPARARRATAFALATNENGDVTTSSPSPTPTARSARCRPAVPDDTARRVRRRRSARRTRARSAAAIGPSESWPERSTSRTSSSSRSPRTGLASGITQARAPARAGVLDLAGLHRQLDRVDERLPRRGDDVLVHADRAPQRPGRRRRRAARA